MNVTPHRFRSYATLALIGMCLVPGSVSVRVWAAEPPPALAVVETVPELTALAELVQADLSQRGTVLVERAGLTRVLAEQRLTAAALTGGRAAIATGRLLRADLFALLSVDTAAEPGGTLPPWLRLRLVETAHGIRLHDKIIEIDPAKPMKSAEQVATRVLTLSRAWRDKLPDAVPLGIMDVRPVQIAERYHGLCRVLPRLLAARLDKDAAFIVLERENLRLVQEEKAFTEGPDTAFWGAAVLIDGSVERSEAGGLELRLRVKRPAPAGVRELTLDVDRAAPGATADKAADLVVRELRNRPPAGAWAPSAEATEFHCAGRLLLSHQRSAEAFPLLETAYALEPANWEYLKALYTADCLSRCSARQALCSDTETAETVARMVQHLHRVHEEQPALLAGLVVDHRFPFAYGFLTSYFLSPLSVATDEVRAINRESRKEWSRLTVPPWPGGVATGYLWARRDLLLAGTDSPAAAVRQLRETLPQMLDLPSEGATESPARIRYLRAGAWLGYWWRPNCWPQHLIDRQGTLPRLWVEYLKELAGSSDPLMALVACEQLTRRPLPGLLGPPDGLRLPPELAQEIPAYRQKAVDACLAGLALPAAALPTGASELLNAERSRIEAPPTGAKGLQAEMDRAEEDCSPLLDRRDVEGLIAYRPVWERWTYHDSIMKHAMGAASALHLAQRRLLLMERLEPLLAAHREDPRVASAYVSVRAVEAGIEKDFPALKRPTPPNPWAAAMVLRPDDWPRPQESDDVPRLRVLCQGNVLWVAFALSQGVALDGTFRASLAAIDLSTRAVLALWQTELPARTWVTPAPADPARPQTKNYYTFWPVPISGLAVTPQASYLALPKAGLLVFPGSREHGKQWLKEFDILAEAGGVPLQSVTGLAAEGEGLWIAYGGIGYPWVRSSLARRRQENLESGLGRYDPQRRKWESVCCSLARGDGPFDAGQPYELKELTLANGRLFFLASGAPGAGGPAGLWVLDTARRELRCLHHGCGTADYRPYGDRIVAGRPDTWWFAGFTHLLRFDPRTAAAQFLDTAPASPKQAPGPAPTCTAPYHARLALEPLTILPPAAASRLIVDAGSIKPALNGATGHGGDLWLHAGSSLIVRCHQEGGAVKTDFMPNDLLDGKPVLLFVDTPFGLVAIGQNSVGIIPTPAGRTN